MTILRANQKDLSEILSLQHLAYQSEAKLVNDTNIPPLLQTLAEIKREFSNGVFLKAVDDDGTILGSVRAHSDGKTLYIGRLIVRPDRQGQGLGTQLLTEIERSAPHKRYELFTSEKSIRNIKLYERRGYRTFAKRPTPSGLMMVFMEKLCE